MRFAILAACLCACPAFAQFNGIGMTPGQQCPYNYGPGQGAMNPRDPVANIDGQLRFKQEQLQRLDGYTRGDVEKIRGVIKSPEAWDFIDRHYKTKGGRDNYQVSCAQGKRRSGSAGGQRANVRNRGRRGAVERGSGLIPIPSDFCTYDDEKEKYVSDWDEVVAENGEVLDEVCNYEVPATNRPVPTNAAARCKRGLASYYERMKKRDVLLQEIDNLKEQAQVIREEQERRYELAQERMQKQQELMLEGQYCAYCAQNNWQQGSAGIMPMVNQNYQIALNYNQRQYMHGRPMPPPQMPWNGRIAPGIVRPGQPTFPGAGRYPALPYAAPVPGFNGIQPGFVPGEGYYGGMPGGAGPGAWGCQGTDAYGMGNPNAPQFMPFQNATANPWTNPFRVNPNTFNPAFRNGLFNPGYGPGFGPQLGNGVYNPNLLNAQRGYAPPWAPWNGNLARGAFGGVGNSYFGQGNNWYNNPALGYGLGVQFPPIANASPIYGGYYAPTPAYNLNNQMAMWQTRMTGGYGLNAPEIIKPNIPGGPVIQQPFPQNPIPGTPVPAAGGAPPAVVRPVR